MFNSLRKTEQVSAAVTLKTGTHGLVFWIPGCSDWNFRHFPQSLQANGTISITPRLTPYQSITINHSPVCHATPCTLRYWQRGETDEKGKAVILHFVGRNVTLCASEWRSAALWLSQLCEVQILECQRNVGWLSTFVCYCRCVRTVHADAICWESWYRQSAVRNSLNPIEHPLRSHYSLT